MRADAIVLVNIMKKIEIVSGKFRTKFEENFKYQTLN